MSSYATASQSLAIRPVAEQVVPTVNLGAMIGRIEEAVDEETAVDPHRHPFRHQGVERAQEPLSLRTDPRLKGDSRGSVPAEHRDGLIRLRERLADNESAIRAHLSAVNEVAMLMQNVIQHAENDGTYSAGEFGYAR